MQTICVFYTMQFTCISIHSWHIRYINQIIWGILDIVEAKDHQDKHCVFDKKNVNKLILQRNWCIAPQIQWSILLQPSYIKLDIHGSRDKRLHLFDGRRTNITVFEPLYNIHKPDQEGKLWKPMMYSDSWLIILGKNGSKCGSTGYFYFWS